MKWYRVVLYVGTEGDIPLESLEFVEWLRSSEVKYFDDVHVAPLVEDMNG